MSGFLGLLNPFGASLQPKKGYAIHRAAFRRRRSASSPPLCRGRAPAKDGAREHKRGARARPLSTARPEPARPLAGDGGRETVGTKDAAEDVASPSSGAPAARRRVDVTAANGSRAQSRQRRSAMWLPPTAQRSQVCAYARCHGCACFSGIPAQRRGAHARRCRGCRGRGCRSSSGCSASLHLLGLCREDETARRSRPGPVAERVRHLLRQPSARISSPWHASWHGRSTRPTHTRGVELMLATFRFTKNFGSKPIRFDPDGKHMEGSWPLRVLHGEHIRNALRRSAEVHKFIEDTSRSIQKHNLWSMATEVM
jgi:hypothetical protein